MIQDRDGDDQHTSSVIDASQDIDSDLTVGVRPRKRTVVLIGLFFLALVY